MMRRISSIFILVVFTVFAYAQTSKVALFSDKILGELELNDIQPSDSLEQILEKIGEPIQIEFEKHPSREVKNLYDYYYIIDFSSYKISIVRKASTSVYWLNSIEIDVNKNEKIRGMLPSDKVEQYSNGEVLGSVFEYKENRLVYEVRENRQYMTLVFDNGQIKKIVYVFHWE